MKRLAAVLALLCALTLSCAFAEGDREALRAAWRQIGSVEGSPYADAPSPAAPYAPGELTGEALQDALDTVNFLRGVAGLSPVRGSEIYDYQCQHAAVLLSALDYVDHNAPKPDDMDRNFYDSAHIGTMSGNIARFNWMRGGILSEGVAYFVRDDGDQNLPVMGHRRWVLNPQMAATGFGLANSASGMSYVVMYAHDLGAPEADWSSVRWPAPGAFPAELMHEHLAWSVSLNPEIYDLAASDPVVTLSEERLGLAFRFRPAEGAGDGFCRVSLEGYGAGGCIIFRPDFEGTGFTDYLQNQRWHVKIDGLKTSDGAQTGMEYAVEMISLYAQDAANIEIDPLEASLAPGAAMQMTASVVPAYADDLTVTWESTDPAVATVDETGIVTAVAPGTCQIVCTNCMGHTDACALTVK